MSAQAPGPKTRPKRGRQDPDGGDERARKKTKPLEAFKRVVVRADWLPDGELELWGPRQAVYEYGLWPAGCDYDIDDAELSPFIAFAANAPAWLDPLVAAARDWMDAAGDDMILGRMLAAAGIDGVRPLSTQTMRAAFRALTVDKKGNVVKRGMGVELRAWSAEKREALLARVMGRSEVSVRLAHAFADPKTNFLAAAFATLNERVISCGPSKGAAYVCVGDLVTGAGEAVTGIYTAATLEDAVRKHYDDLGLVLEGKWQAFAQWVANPVERRHYLGGFTVGDDGPADVFRLVPPLDPAAAETGVPVGGRHFAASVAAKLRDVAKTCGAPTVLAAATDEADALVASLVAFFSRVFGACFVGEGVGAPASSSLVHVFPPALAAVSKQARVKALVEGPPHIWRIVVLTPTPMYSVATLIPPHLYTSSDLLVLGAEDEWEADRTDELRISALDSAAQAVLELLVGSAWAGPARVSAASLKLGLTGKGARSRTVGALCYYAGATSPSAACLALDLPDLATARATFCAVTGVAATTFGP